MSSRQLAASVLLAFAIPICAAQADHVIVNFHRVDEHILRGAQPGPEGVRVLAADGVKTILDLRDGATVKEQEAAEASGIRYVHIPLNGLHAPGDADISRALATLDDRSAWPVFVHCVHGRDRTGTLIACYRIRHDGWENSKALAEAHRYGLSVLELGMKRYILAFQPEAAKTHETR
jgi:protein tyrosine/serine phosphatase